MRKLFKILSIISIMLCYFQIASAQEQWPGSKQPDTMVCSFNCNNTYSELQKRCKPPLLSGKSTIDLTRHINPFIEFGNVIETLQSDHTNPFPLIYTFRECAATCNAASTLDPFSEQIIYYNQAFLDKIKGSDSKVRWAVRCIIAHEIGHHFMGHTLVSASGADSDQRRKRERRADFFSGFVISRFPGATEQDAIEGILTLDPVTYRPRNDSEERTTIYPTLQHRIEAVKEGFNAAKNPKNPLSIAMFKSIDSVAKVQMAVNKGKSSIYHIMDKMLSLGNFNEIKKLADDYLLIFDSQDRAKLLEYKSFADQNLGNFSEAVKNQRKAIELDKANPERLERLELLLNKENSKHKLKTDKIKLESLKNKKIIQSGKLKQNKVTM